MLYSSRPASDFTMRTMSRCRRTAKALSAFRSRRDGTPRDPRAHGVRRPTPDAFFDMAQRPTM